jgi:peptide/nickel transport system ATP-binding protein
MQPGAADADEPTTALDVTIQAQILDLIRRLRDEFGSAVVLVTHDLGVVAEVADRVLVMYAGRIVEEGRKQAIFRDPLHPYTWGLFASIPPIEGERPRRLAAIPGLPPRLNALPGGCAFLPRCGHARPVCSTPPFLAGETDHRSACFIPLEERAVLRAAARTAKMAAR